MTYANQLINALAADDKDQANSAFEALVQDKMTDYLEVRKVELASTIMDDIVTEGQGMDAQRRWTRQVAAVIAADPKKDGKSRSMHRGELKTRARAYFQQMGGVKGQGDQFVDRGAGFVRDARNQMKRQGKLPSLRKEETIDEGGPTRKHFQQVADLIKEIPDAAKRKELAQHHASIFKQQNPRFDHSRFYKAANVDEALETGSKSSAPVSNAQLNRNVLTNLRRATQSLRLKGINPTVASAAHRDFGKLAAKNPKAPGYLLMRKLSGQKAQAMQQLTQAGVPLGGALEANPNDFNQALQRIKRFK